MAQQSYRDGYAAGYVDARRGRARHPRPPLLRSLVSARDFVRNSLIGHREGYLAACRETVRER